MVASPTNLHPKGIACPQTAGRACCRSSVSRRPHPPSNKGKLSPIADGVSPAMFADRSLEQRQYGPAEGEVLRFSEGLCTKAPGGNRQTGEAHSESRPELAHPRSDATGRPAHETSPAPHGEGPPVGNLSGWRQGLETLRHVHVTMAPCLSEAGCVCIAADSSRHAVAVRSQCGCGRTCHGPTAATQGCDGCQ